MVYSIIVKMSTSGFLTFSHQTNGQALQQKRKSIDRSIDRLGTEKYVVEEPRTKFNMLMGALVLLHAHSQMDMLRSPLYNHRCSKNNVRSRKETQIQANNLRLLSIKMQHSLVVKWVCFSNSGLLDCKLGLLVVKSVFRL